MPTPAQTQAMLPYYQSNYPLTQSGGGMTSLNQAYNGTPGLSPTGMITQPMGAMTNMIDPNAINPMTSGVMGQQYQQHSPDMFNGMLSGGGSAGVASTPATGDMNMWQRFKQWGDENGMFSSTDKKTGMKTQGWGDLGLQGLQAGAGVYAGMRQYGLAEEQFKASKDQYNQQYQNQRTLTNARLRDRQAARVASGSGYESVDSYMERNGI